MRFLVIPKDFRNDQYVLEPVLRRLLASLGFPNPKLQVCRDPNLGGIDEVLKPARLEEIVEAYRGMVDVFVVCVDRDADPKRQARLTNLEGHFAPGTRLIAVQAREELETWALAGLDLPAGWRWQDVRSARDVKEAYFGPLARARGLLSEPGGGRRTLGREAAQRIDRIRRRCPEDFDVLAQRIAALRQGS